MTAEVSTQSSPAEARQRAERIRNGIVALSATLDDIAAAYVRRDWASLGYESWEEYVASEYGEARIPALSRDKRREIVGHLRDGSLSTRAIAAVIGVSQPTVLNDLAGDQNLSPAQGDSSSPKVTGADGRVYPSSRPRPVQPARQPASAPASQPPDDEDIWDAEVIEDDGTDIPFAWDTEPQPSAEETAGRVRDAMDAHLPPDTEGPHLEWRRRFLAEIARCSRLVAEFTAGSIAEHADGECMAEFARITRQLVRHYEEATRLGSPPAGVVSLAGRRK